MGTNDRRRQKKLERRNAKRKERRRELTLVKNQGLAERLSAAASGTVVHCLVQRAIESEGIGQLVVSREVPGQRVAFAVFLIDAFCLGVKNAFGNVVPRGEYNKFHRQFHEHGPFLELALADARRLIDDAVAYARRFGIEPHPDYHRTHVILTGVDGAAATRRFHFGDENGKPNFIAGPHDGPLRCREIVDALHHHCGRDGYHFMIPATSASGNDDLEDDDPEAWEIEDQEADTAGEDAEGEDAAPRPSVWRRIFLR